MFNGIEVNDELIQQWEPKVQKMSSVSFVLGMDNEDIAQELRIAIIKAAQGFDEDRGVIFHTYLHTAMVNTIRTLISRGQRQPIDLSLESTSIFNSGEDDNVTMDDTLEASDEFMQEVEFNDLLKSSGLSLVEQDFIILRLEGMNMDEISKDLQTSAYKIRDNLKERIGDLIEKV